jgi:hypothetical protein
MDELTESRNARDAEDTIRCPVPGAPPIAGDGLGAGGATGSGGDRARAESNDDEITDPPKVGDLDPNGLKIDKIFKSTRRFVIYEAAGSVRYILPKSSNTGRTLAQRIAGLGGLRASIDDLRAESCISNNEKERAARELCWALALAFEEAFEDGDNPPSEEPKQILTRVDARLRSLVKSHYRKKYVLANLAAFIAIEFVLICFAAALEVRQLNAGHLPILHHYAIYAAFGALGAFLSVITGIRSIDLDINLKTWEYAFAGATRISIGVIGALVVALALDSKFIDPTFGSPPQSLQLGAGNLQRHIAIYLLLTFVGGFSESLVPNLLRRAEQATGGDTPKPSDEPIVKDIKP